MKAFVLEKPDSYPSYKEVEAEVVANKKKILVKSSAMNHRDVWICKGLYPGIKYPVILGSDAAGIYEGKEVLINPSHNWGEEERLQGNEYRILGLPDNGSFAEEMWVEEKYIYDKPQHLNWEEAAALPLAGLTAYRALLTQAHPRENDKVLITGIGGGVALFALQFALALGLKAWVNSSDQKKIDKAIQLGAEGGVNYRDEDWLKNLKKLNSDGFDIVIDGAGGKDFGKMLNLVNPGGRAVIYGGTAGKISSLNPQLLFWKQIRIQGSTMGSDMDFKNMLAFVEQHRIHPVIDSVFALEVAKQGFERMDSGQQFGKIVFRNQ